MTGTTAVTRGVRGAHEPTIGEDLRHSVLLLFGSVAVTGGLAGLLSVLIALVT